MKSNLYVTQDAVSSAWSDIFQASNDEEVIRMIRTAATSPSIPPFIWEDLSVYCVGELEESPCAFDIRPVSFPRLVCHARDFPQNFTLTVPDEEVFSDAES